MPRRSSRTCPVWSSTRMDSRARSSRSMARSRAIFCPYLSGDGGPGGHLHHSADPGRQHDRSAALTVHVGAAGVRRARRVRVAMMPDADRDAAGRRGQDLAAAMPMIKVVLPKSPALCGRTRAHPDQGLFREGVGARDAGPLAAVGDAFTVSGLDKRRVRRRRKRVGGMRYTVLTWNSVLGALKSGDYPLALELAGHGECAGFPGRLGHGHRGCGHCLVPARRARSWMIRRLRVSSGESSRKASREDGPDCR